MAISKRAKQLTEKIYELYGSGTGWLFGIDADKRGSVEAIVDLTLQFQEQDKTPDPKVEEKSEVKMGTIEHPEDQESTQVRIARVEALTKGNFLGCTAVHCLECGETITPANWKKHYDKCDFAEKKEVKNEKDTL